jgi:hypothetical protein
LLLSLALLGYSGARAYTLSFTHDESYTYLHGVQKPFAHVAALSFKDANNHPLNTWGMFLFARVLGSTELSLRIPNLLAHVLYLLSTYSLVRHLRTTSAAVAAFLLFNAHPYLLEYFALARGYGIGLGLLAFSLLLGFQSFRTEHETRALLWAALSIAAASLSVFANYVFAYSYLPLLFCLLVGRRAIGGGDLPQAGNGLSPRTARGLLLLFMLWNSLMLALSAGREVLELQRRGAFYVGGSAGFWQDVVLSLTRADLQGMSRISGGIALVLALLLGGTLVPLVLALLRRGPRGPRRAFAAMALALYFSLASFFLLARLGGVGYPNGRTALLLVPLAGMSLLFLISVLEARVEMPARLAGWAMLLLGTAAALNLLRSANLTTTSDWEYDADTKRMLADLAPLATQRSGSPPVTLGVTWWYEPAINFYRVTRDLDWLQPVSRDGPRGAFDFYYLESVQRETAPACQMEILSTYPTTGNLLARCAPTEGDSS